VCPVACPSVEKGNTKNGCVLLQTGHEVVRCGRAQGTASNVSAQRVLRFLSFWLAFATRLCLKRRMSSTNTHVGHNSQLCTVKHSLRIRVHPPSFRCPSLAFLDVDFPVRRYKNRLQKYSDYERVVIRPAICSPVFRQNGTRLL
jgi:hypothetical protein